MAAQLERESTYYKQASGTVGINDWMEVNGSPHTEVFRVTSDADGDYFFCDKINNVKSVRIQNHGATFATGAATDSPKVTVTQSASSGKSAKIAIGHTATKEVFSVKIIGDL